MRYFEVKVHYQGKDDTNMFFLNSNDAWEYYDRMVKLSDDSDQLTVYSVEEPIAKELNLREYEMSVVLGLLYNKPQEVVLESETELEHRISKLKYQLTDCQQDLIKVKELRGQ